MEENEKQEIKRQNVLIKEYLDKFIPNANKQKQLLNTFTMSEVRYYLSSISIEFFAMMYFPDVFTEPFGEPHFELFKQMEAITHEKNSKRLVCCPRSIGKSTLNTMLLPLYMILFQKLKFVLIIGANTESAGTFLLQIKDTIESNEIIKQDFGVKPGNIWNSEQAVIISQSKGIKGCIMIRGIGSSMRGCVWLATRPNLIVMDDVQKEAKTATDIEKITSAFSSVVIPLGDANTNILIVGTVLSEDDMISQILDGRIGGVKTFRTQAIKRWSQSPLWEQWQRIYCDIGNLQHIEDGNAFYAAHKAEMLAGTEVLWEARPYYWLMQQKVTMSDAAFWCEYQNEPKNSRNYLFKDIQYWDRLPDLDTCRLILYCDPAIQVKKQSDSSAVCLMAENKQTRQLFIVDSWKLKLTPTDLFTYILNISKQYPQIQTIYFESNAAQSFMCDKLKETFWDNKDFTSIESIYNSKKKEDRILAIQPLVKNGALLFNKDNLRFNEEIMNYNAKSAHDDCIDSVAGAVACFQKAQPIKFFDIRF